MDHSTSPSPGNAIAATEIAPTEIDSIIITRAQDLKTWVGTAFFSDEDSPEIDYAVSKLIKGKPDPEKADDGYLQRILQHPSIPMQYVYCLLALLLRRRGGRIPDGIPSVADEDLLARAVRKHAHAPSYGLHRCMMTFTALFPSGDHTTWLGYLTGGKDAARSLLRMTDEGDTDQGETDEHLARDLLLRLSDLYGHLPESEGILLDATTEFTDKLVAADDIPGLVDFYQKVSKQPVLDMGRLAERLNLHGMDFALVYWSIVTDHEQRGGREPPAAFPCRVSPDIMQRILLRRRHQD